MKKLFLTLVMLFTISSVFANDWYLNADYNFNALIENVSGTETTMMSNGVLFSLQTKFENSNFGIFGDVGLSSLSAYVEDGYKFKINNFDMKTVANVSEGLAYFINFTDEFIISYGLGLNTTIIGLVFSNVGILTDSIGLCLNTNMYMYLSNKLYLNFGGRIGYDFLLLKETVSINGRSYDVNPDSYGLVSSRFFAGLTIRI